MSGRRKQPGRFRAVPTGGAGARQEGVAWQGWGPGREAGRAGVLRADWELQLDAGGNPHSKGSGPFRRVPGSPRTPARTHPPPASASRLPLCFAFLGSQRRTVLGQVLTRPGHCLPLEAGGAGAGAGAGVGRGGSGSLARVAWGGGRDGAGASPPGDRRAWRAAGRGQTGLAAPQPCWSGTESQHGSVRCTPAWTQRRLWVACGCQVPGMGHGGVLVRASPPCQHPLLPEGPPEPGGWGAGGPGGSAPFGQVMSPLFGAGAPGQLPL